MTTTNDEGVGARYSHFVADECLAEDGKVVVGWSHGPIPPGPDGISRDLKSVGPAPDGWALVGDSKAPNKFSFAPIGAAGGASWSPFTPPFRPGEMAGFTWGQYERKNSGGMVPVNGAIYAIPCAVPPGAAELKAITVKSLEKPAGQRDWTGRVGFFFDNGRGYPGDSAGVTDEIPAFPGTGGDWTSTLPTFGSLRGVGLIWLAFIASKPNEGRLIHKLGELRQGITLALPVVAGFTPAPEHDPDYAEVAIYHDTSAYGKTGWGKIPDTFAARNNPDGYTVYGTHVGPAMLPTFV